MSAAHRFEALTARQQDQARARFFNARPGDGYRYELALDDTVLCRRRAAKPARAKAEAAVADQEKTYGCACASDDAKLCASIRYGRDEDSDELCECSCHNWHDDEPPKLP